MLIAKEVVNTGVKIFKSGEEITAIDREEAERLISLGAAVVIGDLADVAIGSVMEERPEIKAFRIVLDSMVKKAKLEYAEKAGINGLNESMTTNEMTELLIVDAKDGVDIGAFSDEQLDQFAAQLGISTTVENREELMTRIENKLQG